LREFSDSPLIEIQLTGGVEPMFHLFWEPGDEDTDDDQRCVEVGRGDEDSGDHSECLRILSASVVPPRLIHIHKGHSKLFFQTYDIAMMTVPLTANALRGSGLLRIRPEPSDLSLIEIRLVDGVKPLFHEITNDGQLFYEIGELDPPDVARQLIHVVPGESKILLHVEDVVTITIPLMASTRLRRP
jgi:hypothetical protein